MSPSLRKASVRPSIAKRLRGNLIAGLVVVLPIWLTCQFVLISIDTVEAFMRLLVPLSDNTGVQVRVFFLGLGLLILAAATLMIGYVAKYTVGRKILGFADSQIDRFPVVRSIYGATKQLVITIFEKSDRSFQETCLIEYPHENKWAISLIEGDAHGEIPRKIGEAELVALFMPTTPNPITGFLFYVPIRDIESLKMSVEDAAKLIISAGIINPPRRLPTMPQDSVD